MTQPSNSSNNCAIRRKKVAKKHDLVGILINDSNLLNRWSHFCSELECPEQYKLRWDRGINNRTFHYFEVFSEMLNDWVDRNSNKKTVDDLCRVLRGIECVAVAEKLESDFKTEEIIQQCDNSKRYSAESNVFLQKKVIQWPIKHGLSVPIGNFTGRDKKLQEIKAHFYSEKNLMLITGFGGIGKTELCRQFSYKIANITSCVWLHGENYETLRDSVFRLAGELGITNEGDPTISEYFEYIASFILENSNRLLLVIDNVDVSYAEVVKIIEIIKMAKYEKMFVIVTSRDRNVLKRTGITMQLDVLSKSNAISMLQTSMIGFSDSDADTLSELIQYFPLALQQALAYIKQQREHFRTPNYSVSDYVREFEVKRSKMLGHELNQIEHNYSMTTLVTWDMTICKMSEGAVEILKILAYLDPDGVELVFLDDVCKRMNVVDFDEGLNLLKNYCLVKIDKLISVHRLVQEVMRGKVDIVNYPKTLFDCVFLVCWELFGRNGIYFSDNVHLNSVYKFAWRCKMQSIKYFDDYFDAALSFLLKLDRIDCAEKLIKLKYSNIQFSSEFLVEKKEFLEKVFMWYFVCQDSRTKSKDIVNGEFEVDWGHAKYEFSHSISLKALEGFIQISVKHFGENSKVTFVVKNLLVRKLRHEKEFDKALQLCEQLAAFEDKDDKRQANFLFTTIFRMLWALDDELESCTSSRLASLDKIINHLGKSYPNNDSIQWMELQASWCDLKGDYKQALELFTKRVHKSYVYEYKIIELKIILTDFDKTTVKEFLREFSGMDVEYLYFKVRGLKRILPIYEGILGESHELTINLKMAMAGKLRHRNTIEKEKCIKLCEQVLRSKFDRKYEDAFEYLCMARDIIFDSDEQRKILQNLWESKRNELWKYHRNTRVVLKLLEKVELKSQK